MKENHITEFGEYVPEPEGKTPEARLAQFANLVWATGVAEGNEVSVTVGVHQRCADIKHVLELAQRAAK